MRWFILSLLGLFLTACNDDTASLQSVEQVPVAKKVTRSFDYAQLKQGGELFQQHCATCHGEAAQGNANWQQRNEDGTFPPPPLNGTAHAWHHSKDVLLDVIKNGTARMGGKMPAWQGKLSDKEIDAIIAWFQSKWPDEIYAVWLQNNAQQ